MPELTPEQRSLRARIGAYAALAKHGRQEMTKAARAANPSSDDYWLSKVDADLPLDERIVRAGDMKRAHFAGLALLSAKSRKKAS
jgi:hypothetical protein